MKSKSVATLYFDGACEPINPGGVATGGWVIFDDGQQLLGQSQVFKRGDGATNNYAEWCALGCGLKAFLEHRDLILSKKLFIYGDSMLVINQLNGKWKCNKEHLRKLRDRCKELLVSIDLPWSAEWIPREKNEESDALSREAYEDSTGRTFPKRAMR